MNDLTTNREGKVGEKGKKERKENFVLLHMTTLGQQTQKLVLLKMQFTKLDFRKGRKLKIYYKHQVLG